MSQKANTRRPERCRGGKVEIVINLICFSVNLDIKKNKKKCLLLS